MTGLPQRGRAALRWLGRSTGVLQQRVLESTDEPALSSFYEAYTESPLGAARFVVRHPVSSLAAAVAIARLPRLDAELSARPDGRVIRSGLERPGLLGAPLGRSGVAVLEIPADPADYRLGASKQTLRRKMRAAERKGVTWRRVDDPDERRALVELGDGVERTHRDVRYRKVHADNTDMLEHDLWLAAFDQEGVPLLLSVTPTDGAWAQLRYFRVLGNGPVHSDTRYLMFAALVDALAARGVHHLVDTASPVDLPNGLRHFQRMIGFRMARIVVSGRPAGRAPRGPMTGAGDADRTATDLPARAVPAPRPSAPSETAVQS